MGRGNEGARIPLIARAPQYDYAAMATRAGWALQYEDISPRTQLYRSIVATAGRWLVITKTMHAQNAFSTDDPQQIVDEAPAYVLKPDVIAAVYDLAEAVTDKTEIPYSEVTLSTRFDLAEPVPSIAGVPAQGDLIAAARPLLERIAGASAHSDAFEQTWGFYIDRRGGPLGTNAPRLWARFLLVRSGMDRRRVWDMFTAQWEASTYIGEVVTDRWESPFESLWDLLDPRGPRRLRGHLSCSIRDGERTYTSSSALELT